MKNINYCPSCGYKIEGDVKFCPGCGKQLKESTSAKIEKTLADAAKELSDLITNLTNDLCRKIDSSEKVSEFTDPVKKVLCSLGFKAEDMNQTALLGILAGAILMGLVLLGNILTFFLSCNYYF